MRKGLRLGSYTLVELVGAGGMGEVWRAQHAMLQRDAAVKIISPSTKVTRDDIRLFTDEARAAAALENPHSVKVHDFGVAADGAFFYAMELLQGASFAQLVAKHGPMAHARVVYLLRQVCASLGEAHARKIVHRDIKPANLFAARVGLTHDFAKVLDFGLATRV